MKSSSVFFTLGLACSAFVDAVLLETRQARHQVVSLDTQRAQVLNVIEHDHKRLRRRSNDFINATADNEESLYFINATIGTPRQHFRLHLDTGSSDLWVNAPVSEICSDNLNPCKDSGTYKADASSTSRYISGGFNISYMDGSGAAGDYVADTVNIAGTDISDLQFGVGYQSSSPQSILGLGYPENEVQVIRGGKRPYENLPAKMVTDGSIASNAFSIWLNDLDSHSGSLIFGGVDRSRFEGDLISVPIQKSGGKFSEFFITMTGLDVGSHSVREDMALAVLLDSGSSLSYLPDGLAESVYDIVNATFQENQGVAFVPCSLRDQTASMTFYFSSPAKIEVPIREMVLDPIGITGRKLSYDNGISACLFGIAPSGSSTNVLGDTFLRSAYVVYDMENNEISLAQTKFNSTESDIVAIGNGGSAVPLSTSASKPVDATSGLPKSDGSHLISSRPSYLSLYTICFSILVLVV